MNKLELFRSPLLIVLTTLLLLWSFIFRTGISTAYDVWVVSEIYNHCLLIIPVCVYLIYERWPEVKNLPLQPNLLLILPIFALLFVQLFAEVGDIKVLMHIATFTSLPLLIWLFVGNQIANQIKFPLFFILFAIPIGDQIIPHLQELTTDIAVPLLEMTGVPVYRNGLYLDIPAGRFLVAEACSGISFLITTVAFGFLYSYLFFSTKKFQISFVILSLLIPIAANALRVYGIILVAHMTDMEHAVGTDHLVYGGVFFGAILILLGFIGEVLRKFEKPTNGESKDPILSNQSLYDYFKLARIPLITIIVLCCLQQIWTYSATHIAPDIKTEFVNNKIEKFNITAARHSDWQPKLNEEIRSASGSLHVDKSKIYFHVAKDVGSKETKLIRSTTRLYDQQSWSLLDSKTVKVAENSYEVYNITSPIGERLTLIKWYEISDRHFSSDARAKLFQAWSKLTLSQEGGWLFILAIDPQDTNLNELLSYSPELSVAIKAWSNGKLQK